MNHASLLHSFASNILISLIIITLIITHNAHVVSAQYPNCYADPTVTSQVDIGSQLQLAVIFTTTSTLTPYQLTFAVQQTQGNNLAKFDVVAWDPVNNALSNTYCSTAVVSTDVDVHDLVCNSAVPAGTYAVLVDFSVSTSQSRTIYTRSSACGVTYQISPAPTTLLANLYPEYSISEQPPTPTPTPVVITPTPISTPTPTVIPTPTPVNTPTPVVNTPTPVVGSTTDTVIDTTTDSTSNTPGSTTDTPTDTPAASTTTSTPIIINTPTTTDSSDDITNTPTKTPISSTSNPIDSSTRDAVVKDNPVNNAFAIGVGLGLGIPFLVAITLLILYFAKFRRGDDGQLLSKMEKGEKNKGEIAEPPKKIIAQQDSDDSDEDDEEEDEKEDTKGDVKEDA